MAVSLQARSIDVAHGDGVRVYALIASIGAALAACTQIVAGRMADTRMQTIGHRREFYWFSIAAIPAMLWFFIAPSTPQLIAAFFFLQITLNIAAGPYQAAIPDHAPLDRRGEISSWMSGYQSLGNAVGLLIAGFIANQLLVGIVLSAALLASFIPTIAHTRTLHANEGDDAGAAPHILSVPVLFLICSRAVIYLGFFTVLGFLFFFVRDSLGVHDPQAQRMHTALIFLGFTLAAIPGAIFAGRTSDRHDKRLIVSLSGAAIVTALIALACVRSLAMMYPAAILAGAAWGALLTADWALACVMVPRGSSATAMGIWNVAVTAPQILAPLLTAPIVLHFNALHPGTGPRAAMFLACIAFTIGTTLIWRVPSAFAAPRA